MPAAHITQARCARAAAALCAAALLSGCSAVSYYWQAFNGQMELGRRAQPVEQVLAGSDASADLKRKLAYAQRARDFASAELGLPDNQSYRRYADVQRPYVVWNVFSAPELALTLNTHCFPVAGCVPYRGYFAEAAAQREATALRAAGDDVYVGGVPAYSTLGWFDDPLLNTFMHSPDLEIARLIFHELSHQVAYVKDDATFNESYAVAVEEEGMRRWAAAYATPEQRAQYERLRARQHALVALLLRGRARLDPVYAGDAGAAEKRAGKTAAINALKADYAAVSAGWGLTEPERQRYDEWFARDLNNARLGSVAVYTDLVPAFTRLLARERGNMPAFHARVQELAALPRAERRSRLAAIP